MMNDIWSSLREEMQYKYRYLSRAFAPIKQAWDEITEPISRVFWNMYNRDIFYIRTVQEWLDNAASTVG